MILQALTVAMINSNAGEANAPEGLAYLVLLLASVVLLFLA